MRLAKLLVVFALSALAGCVTSETTKQAPAAATWVPSATRFEAALDQGLASGPARFGDPIVATVKTPIASADGATVVSPGARVFGHVAGVTRRGGTTLRIAFDRIETVRGEVPLDAFLADVRGLDESLTWQAGREGGVETNVRPAPPPWATGGGPTDPNARKAPVVIPRGAVLEIVIRSPLRLPAP